MHHHKSLKKQSNNEYAKPRDPGDTICDDFYLLALLHDLSIYLTQLSFAELQFKGPACILIYGIP